MLSFCAMCALVKRACSDSVVARSAAAAATAAVRPCHHPAAVLLTSCGPTAAVVGPSGAAATAAGDITHMLHTLIAPPYLPSSQRHAVNNSTNKLVAYICAPSAGKKNILQNVMLSTAVQ